MMLIGRVFKEGAGWSAHCEIVGVFTQGPSRKVAIANLAEAIELKVERAGFKVTVTEHGGVADGTGSVFVEANEPAMLGAEVLKYQREINKLSLADVAKALGSSSRNAYASYEQGQREPSLSKFRELLAVVAPDMALIVGPRAAASPRRKPKARSST